MEAPTGELRARIAEYENTEEDAQAALDLIERALLEARPDVLGEPYDVLAAVDSWAGLMSYVVTKTYAPHSDPRYPGWVLKVPERLRRTADQLRGPLVYAATHVGASDFSISVGFPWGVSVGLSWPLSAQA